MYIVVIGWMYVVLMMSITEESAIAGIMTFLMYGAVPVAIILYLSGTRQRRHRRAAAEKQRKDAAARSASDSIDGQPDMPAMESRTESDTKPEN
jgi:TRAP-type C4-dicarboxylate transport system permease small subunit